MQVMRKASELKPKYRRVTLYRFIFISGEPRIMRMRNYTNWGFVQRKYPDTPFIYRYEESDRRTMVALLEGDWERK